MRAQIRSVLLLAVAAALAVGVARGTAGSPSAAAEHAVAALSKGRAAARARAKLVSARLILRLRAQTWRWQSLMGVRPTQHAVRPRTRRTLRFWRGAARRASRSAARPPHRSAWECIHRYEGLWSDGSDPYWGGLQMDRSFMLRYAPAQLLRRGWANAWSPVEQMWVAERALRSGVDFGAWPNASRLCGLV
jgi:hypothetical protein